MVLEQTLTWWLQIALIENDKFVPENHKIAKTFKMHFESVTDPVNLFEWIGESVNSNDKIEQIIVKFSKQIYLKSSIKNHILKLIKCIHKPFNKNKSSDIWNSPIWCLYSKKLILTDKTNFKPVSLLPLLSKVETFLNKWLCGFLKAHSMQHALFRLLKNDRKS